MDDAELGQQLASRAMSLVRAGADRDAAVRVLIGVARSVVSAQAGASALRRSG